MGRPPYKYEKLRNPHKEIRLLTVLPCGTNREPLVKCRMLTHDISMKTGGRATRILRYMHLPIIQAVSYVWGEGDSLKRDHEIYCDGRPLAVTKHVHNGLKAQLGAIPYTLWIDAICINQADDEEKSAQIPLMLDIYHRATIVVIWLGEATEDSWKATNFVKHIMSVRGYMPKLNDTMQSTHLDRLNKKDVVGVSKRIKENIKEAALRNTVLVAYSLLGSIAKMALLYIDFLLEDQDFLLENLSAKNPLQAEDLLYRSEAISS